MQEQARTRRAALALPREAHGVDDTVDRPILVGVGVDERRALATEFERHRHDALGRRAHDHLADLGRAGEGELGDPGMIGERAAALLAVAGDHVQHARRQEFLADVGHHQNAHRRVLGRLQHQHVTGAKCRGDLERSQHHRRIPRDDGADDADRLAARVGKHVLAQRHGLALELRRKPAEVPEDVGREPGLAACLGAQRVAGLKRDGACHLLGPRLHRLGDLQQKLAAFARHHVLPGHESLVGRSDRKIDVGGGRARHLGHGGALAGILHRDAQAGNAADPLAVDQHALGPVGAGGLGERCCLWGGHRHVGPPVLKKRAGVWPACRDATRPARIVPYLLFFKGLRFRRAVISPYFMPSSLSPSGSRKKTA